MINCLEYICNLYSRVFGSRVQGSNTNTIQNNNIILTSFTLQSTYFQPFPAACTCASFKF